MRGNVVYMLGPHPSRHLLGHFSSSSVRLLLVPGHNNVPGNDIYFATMNELTWYLDIKQNSFMSKMVPFAGNGHCSHRCKYAHLSYCTQHIGARSIRCYLRCRRCVGHRPTLSELSGHWRHFLSSCVRHCVRLPHQHVAKPATGRRRAGRRQLIAAADGPMH